MVESAMKKIERLRRSNFNVLQMQVQLSLSMSKCSDMVNQLQELGDFTVDAKCSDIVNQLQELGYCTFDRSRQILSSSSDGPKLLQPLNQSSTETGLSSMITPVPQFESSLVQRPEEQVVFIFHM